MKNDKIIVFGIQFGRYAIIILLAKQTKYSTFILTLFFFFLKNRFFFFVFVVYFFHFYFHLRSQRIPKKNVNEPNMKYLFCCALLVVKVCKDFGLQLKLFFYKSNPLKEDTKMEEFFEFLVENVLIIYSIYSIARSITHIFWLIITLKDLYRLNRH